MTYDDLDEEIPLGHRPPPPWYNWTIKLALAATALFATVSFLLLIVYLTPTARSNADANKLLVQSNAQERVSDACYDRLSAAVTDGNADVLASIAAAQAEVGGLVVALAAQPRDRALIEAEINHIDTASQKNTAATTRYNAAIDQRAAWVKAGRPLPCPVAN